MEAKTTPNTNDTRVHAAYLRERGFALCLVDKAEKKPTYGRWGTFSKEPDQLRSDDSIGIIGRPISAPAGFALMMVDLDNEEVVKWGDAFLPATGMIEGRPGKPNSHWYYYVPLESIPESAYSPAPQAAEHAKEKYGHPGPKIIRYTDAEDDPVIDFLGTGGQVVCPPSGHPSGERRAWAGGVPDEPARVDYGVLLEAVERLAAHGGYVRPKPNDPSPPGEPAPTSGLRLTATDTSLPINRARKYLAKMPASISHSNGDKKLFAAACRMWNGFALSEDETYRLLVDEFNPRCEPPWPENRIKYKVSQAAKVKHNNPRGHLLNTPLTDHVETDAGATMPESDEPKESRFKWLTARELADRDCRREWFIRGVLTKNEPCGIIGLSKTLKTSLALDAAISMAMGVPFLGNEKFAVSRPFKVGFMSAESGDATLQETSHRICRTKGFRFRDIPDGYLNYCFDVPFLKNQAEVKELADAQIAAGVDFVWLDPFFMMLNDVDAKNMVDVGGVLINLNRYFFQHGVSCGILHHANRKNAPGRNEAGQPLELTDIAYSGLEQWIRQWFLLSRREAYQQDGLHKLFFKWGGSAGHGGLHELDIHEGLIDENFAGRVWEVSSTPWAEAKAAKADERDEKAKESKRLKVERYKTDVLEAIDTLVADNRPATKNALRVKTQHSERIVTDALEALKLSDVIVMMTQNVERNKFSKPETVYIRKPVQNAVPVLFGDDSGASVQESTSVQNDEPDVCTDAAGSIAEVSVHSSLSKRESGTDGRMIRTDKPHKNGKPTKKKTGRMPGSKSKRGAA